MRHSRTFWQTARSELAVLERQGLRKVGDDEAEAPISGESVGCCLLPEVGTDEQAFGPEPCSDLDQGGAAAAAEIDGVAGRLDVEKAGQLAVALGSEHRL